MLKRHLGRKKNPPFCFYTYMTLFYLLEEKQRKNIFLPFNQRALVIVIEREQDKTIVMSKFVYSVS